MLTRRQPASIAARERLVVADAAAHLDVDVEGADDLRLELAVVAAAERRVEVDEVDPLRAGLLPAQRGLDRVAEPLLGAGDALDELHGLAVGDVDGGQELEVGGHAQNPRSRRQSHLGAASQRRPNSMTWSTGAASRLTISAQHPGGRVVAGTTQTRTLSASRIAHGRADLRGGAGPRAGRAATRGRGTSAVDRPAPGLAALPALLLGRPGGGLDRLLALALGAAAGALLAHGRLTGVTGTRPSCAAGRHRRRRTSRGGTGSR